MKGSRCIAHKGCSRRDFINKSSLLTAGTLIMSNLNVYSSSKKVVIPSVRSYGAASGYVPQIRAAFVRRKEEYGMWWPGDIYDGEAARRKYTEELSKEAKVLGVGLDIRPNPIYSLEEADEWLAESKASQADGLMV